MESQTGEIWICCRGTGRRRVRAENCPGLTLWCEMDPKSSLFFSSIGEDSAMLCLNRRVPLPNGTLEPQERRVPYDAARSVGENLLNAATELIQEAVERQKGGGRDG